MIKDKLVKQTVYLSLLVQLVTTVISLNGLTYSLKPEDMILQDILMLEAIVQFVEAGFYIWVIMALNRLEIMTPRRYIDWFITTPTMLVSTIIFMEYKKQKEKGRSFTFKEFLTTHKDNIIKIVILNGLMLLFGYLGEINVLETKTAVAIGSFFFILTFRLIYEDYAKYTTLGKNLFYFLTIVWALYAVAACLNLHYKNTMYNLLDIVSKNFYGLFIYLYIHDVNASYTR